MKASPIRLVALLAKSMFVAGALGLASLLKIVVSSLAIGALCHALPAADVISLNFCSNQGAVGNTTEYGIVAATNWFDIPAWDSKTRTDITSMNGLSLGKLVWNCKNTWQYAGGITDNALKGYLDDGDSGNVITIALTGIPFEYYRVIVYQATDSTNAQFNPPSLNGVFYSYDGRKKSTVRNDTFLKYGASHNATAVIGTNVAKYQRVFSGDMTILGGGNANSARGCIAAVQIVEADVYTAMLTGNGNLDNLDWSPAKPDAGFAAGSVLKVVNEGESPVTLTANGDYSGLGLAISGPIALTTTTRIKSSFVALSNGAILRFAYKRKGFRFPTGLAVDRVAVFTI
jgi:hypothetical protein